MKPGQQGEMPFLEHLEELRWRIVWCLGALAVGVAIGFFVMSKYDVISILIKPMVPYLGNEKLAVFGPTESFRIYMTASLIIGTVIALPVILWHVWGFLSPALYSHEKKVVIPALIFATLLFAAGVALSWFVILPLTLRMFTSIQPAALRPMYGATAYFSFAFSMSLALGAVFELPILIIVLSMFGIVTPQLLNRFRRYAIVGVIVVAAFITPGQDPFSLMALAVPLYLLYEVSVIASAMVQRRRRKREARRALEDQAGETA